MTIVLFIEKNGTIKEMKLKEVIPNELYRKASFKSAEGFDVQTKWVKPGKYNIYLYARKTGRAGSENKYDFPPPVDSELFFGGCILTNKDTTGKYCDLTIKIWNKIYEELFGGFDDIDSNDESCDDEEDKKIPKTKEGYAKDGFIVDDAEIDGEGSQDDSDDELSDDSDIEIENDVDLDDVDTDELCEDSDSDAETDESVESEAEDIDIDDEGDDEDADYESDGSGGIVSQKKKKKATKKPVVVQKNKNKTKTITKSNSAVKQRPSAIPINTKSKSKKNIIENSEVNNGYLNCSDELEEEAYLE